MAGVESRPWLAVPAVTLLRFYGHERGAARRHGARHPNRGDPILRVEQHGTRDRAKGSGDVDLERVQLLRPVGAIDGGKHSAQSIALVHRDDRQRAICPRYRPEPGAPTRRWVTDHSVTSMPSWVVRATLSSRPTDRPPLGSPSPRKTTVDRIRAESVRPEQNR